MWALVVLAILPIAWTRFRYHTSEFKGGERIQNNGWWLFPSYRAQLRPLSLDSPGEQQYTFSGLPSQSFSLTFFVVSAEEGSKKSIVTLHTHLSVALTDDVGNSLCSADGTIAGSRTMSDSTWIMARSANSAYFWTPQCTEMPISRWKQYHLKVRVDSVDPESPKIDLIPILRGGGNELP